MKRFKILIPVILLVVVAVISCKTVGRVAARYWLKKEIKEFVTKCEDKVSLVFGSEKANKYCDCSVDLVAEQYHNYQDTKNLSVTEIIDFINKCK